MKLSIISVISGVSGDSGESTWPQTVVIFFEFWEIFHNAYEWLAVSDNVFV